MIPRLGFVVLASALALGCAGAPPLEKQWTRKDATPEDVKRDLYWCTVDVRRRSRALDTPALGPPQIERKVDDECMQSRGYTKVEPKG
jgi:hypothetical protein